MIFRKTFKYVKTEFPMGELKAGDLFSMEPADAEDAVNVEPNAILLATTDAKAIEPEGRFEIEAHNLKVDASWPGIKDGVERGTI